MLAAGRDLGSYAGRALVAVMVRSGVGMNAKPEDPNDAARLAELSGRSRVWLLWRILQLRWRLFRAEWKAVRARERKD